jgi:hypothetical protein
MVGLTLDFEDGRPEPQNVYAEDHAAMTIKLATMYGNTQVRIGEVKAGTRSTPAAPPTPSTPTTSVPSAPARMTPDQRMQAVADLEDPAKAPAAIIALVREGGGGDLTAEERTKAANAETRRMQGEVAIFMENNPDYFASPKNARLLRDRVYTMADGGVITAATFQTAYDQLEEDGVLESAPAVKEPPPAAGTQEPSAPPATRPRGSTGVRPSALRSSSSVPSGQTMTYSQVMDMAGTDEYADRLKHEPGFRQKVEAVLARGA